MTLGNGLVETTTFNNRLQPCTLTGGTLLTLQFRYGAAAQPDCDVTSNDNNGNLHAQTITGPGLNVTQNYLYDEVNRVELVTEGGWSRTYLYDQWGNRAATGSGITFGHAAPQATGQFDQLTNRIQLLPDGSALDDPADGTGSAPGNMDRPYDEAGNLINHDLVGAMAYDAENKQRFYCANPAAPCTTANADAEYRYDGQGNRVQKLTSAQTITYVYDVAGKLAAEYSTSAPTGSGGTFFRTLDHLGSTRLVTDDLIGDEATAEDDIVSRRDFFPFGEEIPANATFNRQGLVAYNQPSGFSQQFTAKERDDESGLDYFGARYFSASLGRFNSVDPNNAGVRLGNPQSWNGYGYSINNPLRYVDPDGRDFLDAIEGFANAFGSNAVGGIGRVNVGSRPSEAGDFRLGQAVGDAASVVVGTLEVLGGFGTGAGGVAVCGTGVGCAATPAAVATSSVLVVQGGTLAASGLGNLIAAAQDNNPTSGEASQEALIGNNPREAKGRTNTDLPGGQKAATDLFTERTQGQKVTTDPKTGHQVAADGTRLRLNPDGTAPVDVPKSTTRPKHETIHFNDPDKLNQP